MARFAFRFEALLRLRENERDTVRGHVADAIQAQSILEQQRDALHQQREESRLQAQRRLASTQLSVDTLLHEGRFDLQLAAEIQGLDTNIRIVQTEIDRRQETLQVADVEVKRLERLREQQYQQWTVAQLAAEQTELDEIAQLRFARAAASQQKLGRVRGRSGVDTEPEDKGARAWD